MHIILAVAGALTGLIWALVSLQRSGFNLSSLNPLAFFRRTRWQRRLNENPLYLIDTPHEMVGVLLIGLAKCRGDMTLEHTNAIQAILVTAMDMPKDEANDLMTRISFLLRNELYLSDIIAKVFARTKLQFSDEQKSSILDMMNAVSFIDDSPNREQLQLIEKTRKALYL